MSNEVSRTGQLFIVAAPSGAGKTSLLNALVERDPDLVISVSHTTRAPRPGEIPDRHYHFTNEEHFTRMVEAGEFLEHACVFGHFYGTHRDTTMKLLAAGKDVVLEIDWQGARQIRASFPDCHSIFILPPSLESLRSRLSHRAQDSEAVIEARMQQAREEISHASEFDFMVVNDDFEAALSELGRIIGCCRTGADCSTAQNTELLAELLGNS